MPRVRAPQVGAFTGSRFAARLRDTPAIRRWLFAAKPGSWAKLAVPSACAHALALADRSFSWPALVWGVALTLGLLLSIVFLNDWADQRVDATKRRMFPSTSPKTIPDRILPAILVGFAGCSAALATLLLAVVAGVVLDRPLLGPLAALELATFAAYTLPPLRLNYRGGGELLEMVGVGLVLPMFHGYLQSGGFWLSGYALLPGWICFSLASALASGLADERSDRVGGKRTFATVFGNRWARWTVESCVVVGALAWWLAPLASGLSFAVGAIGAGLVMAHVPALCAQSGAARTDAFDAQRRYKSILHRAMWRGLWGAAAVAVFCSRWGPPGAWPS